MKALIIAAGYATRLYPLTQNFPKPLLEVGGKTILDRLVDQVKTVPEIDAICLVTNHRFRGHFQRWADNRMASARQNVQAHTGVRLDILDDGTASNDDRLGAVGDIQFAIAAQNITDDLMVLAADNLLQFPLNDFVSAYRKNPSAHVCVRLIEDPEDRKRRGIALLDGDNRIVDFEEKPEQPKSKWAVPPFYIYPSDILPRIKDYLDAGGISDAPGHFLVWLHKHAPVYAYKIQGAIFDIGNHESLAEARSFFERDRARGTKDR